jgi:hypothetical protein
MNVLRDIRDKWSWEKVLKRERIDLENGDVDEWHENIFAVQGHAYLYYDVAHTQLLLHHISQIKTIVNSIIEKIKKRDFNSKAQVDQINVLIELDTIMTEEYAKTQELFKQNGNLLSEASKLIHYLDSTTFNSENMVKTMLEYHNVITRSQLHVERSGLATCSFII